MNKIGKRHHYIPQFILREFTNERGNVWVFRKGSQSVIEVPPVNIALEKHYNSTYNDGYRNRELESRLAELVENRFAPVLKDLINRIRDGRDPDLPSKKRDLLYLAYIQFTRSRSIKDGFMDQRTDCGTDVSQNEYVRMINANLDCLEEKGDGDIIYPLPGAWEALLSESMGVLCIKNPKKSFVVGDIPLIKVSATEIYFSVAPDIMIYWGRECDEPERKVLPSGDGNIRRFNEMILRDSTLIAGKSERVIKELKDSRFATAKPRLRD